MFLTKKLIHLCLKKNIKTTLLLFFPSLLPLIYHCVSYNLTYYLNNFNLKNIQSVYFLIYHFFYFIRTKHLFLFSIYLIYTKFLKIFNKFYFKFNVLKRKIKKITILRAPCNHKNSKEQYGLELYKGILSSKYLYTKYKYYNIYLIKFLTLETATTNLLLKYTQTLQKNEKKSFK